MKSANIKQKKSRSLYELRVAIQAGIKSGAGTAADEVFNRLEKKYRAMLHNERL